MLSSVESEAACNAFRVCVHSSAFWSSTFEQLIDVAKLHGVTGLECRLNANQGHGIEVTCSASQIRRRAAELAAHGMEMVCLGLPLRLGGDSENDFVPYVELAAHLGCQYLRVFADDKMQAESRQDWIVRVRAALDSYRRLAGSVGLVIENQGDTSACASLVEVLGDDGMILWDTAYSFKAGESYADSISILGSRLAHVQTKDQSREAGNWTRSCLFEGQLFVADALQALRSSGYRGYVSIENQSTSPRQDLARVTRWLNASMRADGFTE